MDFWASIKPRLHLLNVPLYAVTVTVMIGVWLVAGQPIPMGLLFPLAVVVNPALFCALALYMRISRYERALRGLDHSSDHPPGREERDAYRRFKRMYGLRERLAKRWITRDGVYLGHFLKHLQLERRLSQDPMNSHGSMREEARAVRDAMQRRRLNHICRFVYSAPTPKQDEHEKALFDFLQTLPAGCERVSDIIFATVADGEGIFSTLTALTHTHYLLALPPWSVREVLAALTAMDFDPSTYGWLSHRVLEAAIQVHLRDGSDQRSLGASLQPILTETTDALIGTTDENAKSDAKWQARNLFRSELGVT